MCENEIQKALTATDEAGVIVCGSEVTVCEVAPAMEHVKVMGKVGLSD
jgi:hypothetical protein